jgi:hypothetical protein
MSALGTDFKGPLGVDRCKMTQDSHKIPLNHIWEMKYTLGMS